jgi:hypothetical protein
MPPAEGVFRASPRSSAFSTSLKTQRKRLVFAGPGVEVALPLDRERETVWASQSQIEELFGLDQSGVSRHIRNVFRDAEGDRESNLQKIHIASADRPVTYYNLDVITAVGYRANSVEPLSFDVGRTKY